MLLNEFSNIRTYFIMQYISENVNKFDKKFHDDSPSIDRVNSKLGYIKNNVAILCWRCNKVKQDSIPSELRIVADFIDRFNNQISNSIVA